MKLNLSVFGQYSKLIEILKDN